MSLSWVRMWVTNQFFKETYRSIVKASMSRAMFVAA